MLEASSGFPSGEVTPAVAVFRNPDGLTAAERSAVEVARAAGSGAPTSRASSRLAPAVYSRDRTGAFFAVPIRAEGDEEVLIGAVEDVRELVREGLPGRVEAEVTGPAGFSADASKAFEGINTTLLFATVGLVFVLLVLIYRSPIFWALPLVSVLFAESVVRGLGYLLAEAGVVINGQTGGILLVLVFGAGTDYALLLTARYREELHRVEDKHEAMCVALRQAGPGDRRIRRHGRRSAALPEPRAGELGLRARPGGRDGRRGRGGRDADRPAGAPAHRRPARVLAVRPALRAGHQDPGRGAWGRLGLAIERRHRRVWIGSAAGLAVLALGMLTLDDDLTTTNFFRGTVEAVEGQRLLEQSFPAGSGAPTVVLVRDESRRDAALDAARSAPGVASAGRSSAATAARAST